MESSTASQQKQKKRIHPVIQTGIYALLSGGVAYLLLNLFKVERPKTTGSEALLLLIGTVIALLLTLFIHEGGHLLGGLLVKFRFHLLIVGPLKVYREHGKIRIALNKSIAMAGGVAATTPGKSDRLENLTQRLLIMVAGGPLASLVLGAGALGLSFLILSPGFWREQFLILGLLSSIIFIVTAIPAPMGSFYTDGARIRMLLRQDEKAARWCASIILERSAMGDQRPALWDKALIDQITAFEDDSLESIVGFWYGYYAALDRGDIDMSQQLIERLKRVQPHTPHLIREALALEITYFVARYQDQADEAGRWYEKGKKIKEKNLRPTRLRAEAALRLAEGKHAEALARTQEGLRELSNVEFLALRAFEETCLNDLVSMISEKIPSSSL